MKKFLICICLFAATVAALSLTSCKKNKAEEEIRTPVTVEIPFVSDFTCDYYDASGNRIASRSTVFEPDDEIRVKFGFTLSSDAFKAGNSEFTLKLDVPFGFDKSITSANTSMTSSNELTATFATDDRNAKKCELSIKLGFNYCGGDLNIVYNYDGSPYTTAGTLPLNCEKRLKFEYVETLDGYSVSQDYDYNGWLSGSLIIPTSFAGKPVKTVGYGAFKECNWLKSVIVPEGIINVEGSAFADCGSLTAVTLPSSLRNLGKGAFNNCPIEQATIPGFAVRDIPGEKLKDVIIISGDYIDNNTFYNYKNLKSITLADSIRSIGNSAFEGCGNLRGITLPDKVSSIGENAFMGCRNLSVVTLGNSLTQIAKSAFENCVSLTSITIPDGVTTIGESAFYHCNGLTDIDLPDKVMNIEKNTFYGCESLTAVNIGNGVKRVGYSAFENCVSLVNITISESVTSIGKDAFSGCKSLSNITVSDDNSRFKSIDGNLYSKDGQTLMQYAVGKSDAEFTVPDEVTTIGENAFYGCNSLTIVKIGNRVKNIEDNAFNSCGDLTSIIVPDSVTSIGNDVFNGCGSLTDVEIGGGVTSIGESVFGGCGSLSNIKVSGNNGSYKSVDGNLYSKDGQTLMQYAVGKSDTEFTIPDSVTSINANAFCGCVNLLRVSIGGGLKSVGYAAFKGCGSLTSVEILDSVTNIGSAAFRECGSLASVIIGNGVKNIEPSAFWGCDSLTSITIPNSVTRIETGAFGDCAGLTSVTISSAETYVNPNAFEACPIERAIIPKSAISAIPLSKLKNLEITSGDSVDSYIFQDCADLESVTLPDGMTSIGEYAFKNCVSLKIITIPESVTSIRWSVFEGCSSLQSVTLPSGITSVENNTFSGCANLTSVTIPKDVTSIGGNAFDGCVGLTTVTMDDNLKTIGSSAFNGCSRLTGVTIPNSATWIGNYAFYGCGRLTRIEIPVNVTYVGTCAFGGCTSLTEISVDEHNAKYSSKDGDIYTKDGQTLLQYAVGKTAGKVAISNGTWSGSWRKDGYELCGRNGLTSVGSYAFYGCKNLTIVILSGLTSVEDNAFYDCANLTRITIPKSVKKIGLNAFGNCGKLTSITYEGKKSEWLNISSRIGSKSDSGKTTIICSDGEMKFNFN